MPTLSSMNGDNDVQAPVLSPPVLEDVPDVTGERPGSASTQLLYDRPTIFIPPTRPLWNNVITIAGLLVGLITLVLLVTFWLFTLVNSSSNPYVDIIGYLVLPSILVGALGIIPLGILLKSWRLRRHDPTQRLVFRFPQIDLNDPAQRRVGKFFLAGTFVLLPIVAVSSYHGYHYTDSSDFCARACHAVMEPQSTAYAHSAHARVACAECHIGSGASWFVRSKLSGTRQVLAVLRGSYSRPIPPAIRHLRPARETCEQCHWPNKFFGAQLREIVHFASDENNSRQEIDMLLKTGGGDESIGRAAGIHMHMALAGRIEYVATDDKLQEIPWVRMVDDTGTELIYRSDGRPSSDPIPAGEIRQLDCMDCHNRPAHRFRSPQETVDLALELNRIDVTLPFIKREAVAALIKPYPDVKTAEVQIGASLTDFYRANYPDLWETHRAPIFEAIDRVREIYRQTFFPAMKVDWRTYPDNIGHLNSPGCFRCHDGRHINQRNERLSHECGICHTFLNPVDLSGHGAGIRKGEFVHPYELEGIHATLRCDQCHTGGSAPVPSCAGCHTSQAEFRNGKLAAFQAFDILEHASVPAEPMAGGVDCEGCHDLTEPTTIEAMDATCMDCHEDEEERFEGMLAAWAKETKRLLEGAEARTDDAGRRLLQTLRDAGPLHNIEATRIIIRKLQSQSDLAVEN